MGKRQLSYRDFYDTINKITKFLNMVVVKVKKIVFRLIALVLTVMCLYGQGGVQAKAKKLPEVVTKKVLLLPLDSRPACRQFVIDMAKIANVEIVSPPDEILDYYHEASQTKDLEVWLTANFPKADAAIISVDQLFHGGLIASRDYLRSDEEGMEVAGFLVNLHKANPQIPIMAFSTLTRITPSPQVCDSSLWPAVIEYSRLTDEVSLSPSKEKSDRIEELKKEIPPQVLKKYLQVMDDNEETLMATVTGVKAGVFDRVIIGQDDSQEYGIPNMKRRNVCKYIEKLGLTKDKVFVMNGADEIAMSFLAAYVAQQNAYKPKVYVEYNVPQASDMVMPYMAESVGKTVDERLSFFGTQIVNSPAEADYTLFVSCIDDNLKGTRQKSADRIKSLIGQGARPVLVDISRHFADDEMVMPFLLKNDTPVQRMDAYAGWNTVSNAVGTAVSQAVVYEAALKGAKTKDEVFEICKKNIAFLNEGFLEDYYYLKDIIYQVNSKLRILGRINENDFANKEQYDLANNIMAQKMHECAASYAKSKSFSIPVEIDTPEGKLRFRTKDIKVNVFYPWPRTFEIDIRSEIEFEELK